MLVVTCVSLQRGGLAIGSDNEDMAESDVFDENRFTVCIGK